MSVIYTYSTVDSPDYKPLVCGRTDDISELLDSISQGRSVALFGERRLGKSSVLYMVRDIINGDIDRYKDRLIDKDLKNAIDNLKAKSSNHRAIYVNVQGMGGSEIDNFVQLIKVQLITDSLQMNTPHISTVTQVFEELNNKLNHDNRRAVILIDEIEGLLALRESLVVFRNLRSVIETCPQICLVLAGAEDWHNRIKEKTSPIVNNVYPFYLKTPSRSPIERYLVITPLTEYLTPTTDVAKVARTIIEWTGCKPYYVQAVCQSIAENYEDSPLPNDWESIVLEEVETGINETLRAFFTDENLDELSRNILALLANEPGLTIKEISKRLGESEKKVREKVGDLEVLDKVRRRGADYRIIGTLIEQWGKKTRELPKIKNPWIGRLKCAGVVILLLVAFWIYRYTHPDTQIFPFAFQSGVVSVRMPSSLERGETGKALLSVTNTGSETVKSITITLTSRNIDYQHKETNRVTFKSINRREKKTEELTFRSHSPTPGHDFGATVHIIVNEDTKSPVEYPFPLPERRLPIKKYWQLINLFLVGIAGYLTNRDIGKLVTSVSSGLFKSQSESKSQNR